MITTTKGNMDEALLEKREGQIETTTRQPLGLSIGMAMNLYIARSMFNSKTP